MVKTVCIIQARVGSTRLPGKVMKRIEGKEVLLHVIDRVLRAKLIDLVVVAIPEKDDILGQLIEGYDSRVKVFRGSEDNVLDRYYQAAKESSADMIVRITSDCPLADPEVIDRVIKACIDEDLDYVSNTLASRTFPRGLDVEVFRFKILEEMWKKAAAPEEKEHVTWYLRMRPGDYNVGCITNEKDLSHLRWTVDEEEDFRMVSEVYSRLYKKNKAFGTRDILELLEKEPWIAEINASVQQKMVAGKRQ